MVDEIVWQIFILILLEKKLPIVSGENSCVTSKINKSIPNQGNKLAIVYLSSFNEHYPNVLSAHLLTHQNKYLRILMVNGTQVAEIKVGNYSSHFFFKKELNRMLVTQRAL